MVPLRGIFEALNAQVIWNQKAKTVTAKKRDTTIVLTIGARTATVNNRTVSLDSPARVLKGSTMVPVRFVSEALGDDVVWDKLSQSVLITTKKIQEVSPATALGVSAVSQNGDGRDLQVTFTAPSDQSGVTGYRVLVVKAENVASFNLAKALSVGYSNYTAVAKSGSAQRITLTAQSRDVDGALLRANQAYKVFVLTTGSDSNALSDSSISITLRANPSVNSATNVKIEDVGDSGDGRDLRVTFSKASNQDNISGYRVMIVKTANASNFDLSQANGMSSSYYTNVSKTSGSGSLSVTLNSTARDTSGDLIRNGVGYTAFVFAVSSNTSNWGHSLSAGSASVTLGSSAQVPVITGVADVDDNGDGRDLQVTFKKASDESWIGSYRIFVVRESDSSSFNLLEANKVAYSNYYDQYRTGDGNYSTVLPSNLRDTRGNQVTNGVAYRVFVMGISNNNTYANSLSAASSSITLNYSGVSAVTNLSVSDIADYNNGRDLQVSFTKVANEAAIKNYRVFVVKEANVSSFGLAAANAVTNSNNYTTINKTNSYNIVQTLNAGSRDVNGAVIQNGIAYRVFIMSVGNVNGSNALSSMSNSIILSNNNVTAVTNVAVSDIADNNNGQDLRVSFTKASNENNIGHYRAYVVKEQAAGSFNLTTANAVQNYTVIYKNGSNISQALNADSRDVDGAIIQNGIKYKVFVMSVGASSAYGNALSSASPTIQLANNGTVTAVTNVTASDVADNGNGQDLRITFTKASVETNIGYYRIFVVPDSAANLFTLNAANAITNPSLFTMAYIGANYNQVLANNAVDIYNNPILNNVPYRIFVLSVGVGPSQNVNVLSAASPVITLTSNTVPAATGVSIVDVGDAGNGSDLQITFARAADETNLSQYRIFIVKDVYAAGFQLETANVTSPSLYTTVAKNGSSQYSLRLAANSVDVNGETIKNGVNYRAFVLSVGNNGANALSLSSNPLTLAAAVMPAPVVSGVTAVHDGAGNLTVSYSLPAGEVGISQYAVFAARASVPLNEAQAIASFSGNAGNFMPVGRSQSSVVLTLGNKSTEGAQLTFGETYYVYVLSVADGYSANAHKLSAPSQPVTLTQALPPQ